ncbi:MAG: glycerol-3-phosphate 1-O-acyltransferase PlsY [Clostridiales bacterium]|nr:glycerol-3-phosphate 1-O-acyltransferase PlsY [Clostridiales bacterium]
MTNFLNTFMNTRVNGLISPYYDYKMPLAMAILLLAICAITAYILGSINFAILLSKHKYKEDIRSYGSGNGGMTNMMRTYGRKSAALTFGGDLLKAFLSITIGCLLMGILGGYVAGLFCIVGHCFPLYYHFKGGKGVAVTAMTILLLSPLTFIVLFTIFVIIVVGYKYISLGSVMCMLMYPLLLTMTDRHGPEYAWIALIIAALVIFMHRSNIKRLLNRTESKFEFKKQGARSEEKEKSTEAESNEK